MFERICCDSSTSSQIENGNDKARAFLEDCNANSRILPQLKYDVKSLQFGRHKLQSAASEDADQNIQALMAPHQAAYQAIVLTARQKLRDDIADFDVKTLCEEFAQEKWIACAEETDQRIFRIKIIISITTLKLLPKH